MSTTENPRDCAHGHLRRTCPDCYLLAVAKGYVGWDATPEEAMDAMHGKIQRLERELQRYKDQHEFDCKAKQDLRLTVAKLLATRGTE